MLLKPNMSMNPNNTTDVADSSIWNTLSPSRLEMPNDIDDSDDKENDDDDLSPVPVESEKTDYMC